MRTQTGLELLAELITLPKSSVGPDREARAR